MLRGCLYHTLFGMEIGKVPHFIIISVSFKAFEHTSHIPNTQ